MRKLARTKGIRRRRLKSLRDIARKNPKQKLGREKASRRDIRHAERKPDPYEDMPVMQEAGGE